MKRKQNRPRNTDRALAEVMEPRVLFATFNVTSLAGDSGAGTLRQAIGMANALGGADTIQFAAALSGGTIALSGGELALNEAVTIDARPLAQNVTINAGGLSRVFNIPNAAGNYTFGGLTLTGGKTTANNSDGLGGAIRSRTTGTLTIERCTFTNNETGGTNADGGALSTLGPATISQSTISGNRTSGFRGRGGGIQVTGALTLTNSTVTGNSTTAEVAFGGGIMAGAATTIERSTISGNSTAGATAFGGGILSAGDLTFTDSTISGNRTKGTGASGGGIATGGVTILTLTRSTVSGNISDLSLGAAAYANGSAVISQSTITDNHAPQVARGGGVVQPNLTVNAPVTVSNSIVTGNTGGGSPFGNIEPGPESTLTVNYSLIDTGVFLTAGGNNIRTTDPQLALLASNGGPTQTHRPLTGSPVIDAGDPGIAPNPTQFDQRSAPFVRVFDNDGAGGARIDIGAAELQPLIVSTTADVANGNFSTGNFSLREAIGVANTMSAEARITFAVNGTITLAGTELGITNGVTMTGPGANVLTVSGNNASRVMNIGGGGTVSISGITITGGNAPAGAGINNAATTLNLDSVVLTGNTASAFGGGLASAGGGAVTIRNSTLSNNTAGNEAGAIEAQGVAGSLSTVTLINSTISGNITNGSGFGAISNVASGATATLTLQNCTIANNTGAAAGGVLNAVNSGSAATTYIGTVFANSGPNIVSFGGTVTSLGHNLSSDNTGNLTATGDLPNRNPLLGTLGNNGGPTPTLALLPNSPAINAGVAVSGITNDQRGVSRPQGSASDIGAFERQATAAALTNLSYEFETRQAAIFNFSSDASVTFSRSSYTLQNLTTGQMLPASIGSLSFNSDGTQAALVLTNLLADGNYRLISSENFGVGLGLDFYVFAGDANRDRTIDIGDFSIVATRFNQPGTFSQGNFNYDALTDIGDFAVLASKFNTTLPAARSGPDMAGTHTIVKPVTLHRAQFSPAQIAGDVLGMDTTEVA